MFIILGYDLAHKRRYGDIRKFIYLHVIFGILTWDILLANFNNL